MSIRRLLQSLRQARHPYGKEDPDVGGSLRDVQLLLAGHTNLRTTQEYFEADAEAPVRVGGSRLDVLGWVHELSISWWTLQIIAQPSYLGYVVTSHHTADEICLRRGVYLVEVTLAYRLCQELAYTFVQGSLDDNVRFRPERFASRFAIDGGPFPKDGRSVEVDFRFGVGHGWQLRGVVDHNVRDYGTITRLDISKDN